MKKLIVLVMAVALVVSMNMLSVFAVKEALPIDGDTLREVNDAQDVPEDQSGMSGPTWSGVGHWRDGTGGPDDCLVPFSTEDWTAVGVTGDTHLVFMNYGNYIRVSKNIDFTKYSKMYVTYSTAGDITDNELGFFSKATDYGHGDTKNTDGLVVSVPLESDYEGYLQTDIEEGIDEDTPTSPMGWQSFNTVEVDVSSINYLGELYASYYMAQPNGICVLSIEFELAEGGSGTGDQGGNADTDFNVPWKLDKDSAHVKYVSYDEVIPGILCQHEQELIEKPAIASGTKEVTFSGWIGSDADSVPVAFTYSVNGGKPVKSTAWMMATEEAVVKAAEGQGATYAQRFDVKVPIDADGTRVVRVYAEFENGTHELIWVAELTVGNASNFTDAGDNYSNKGNIGDEGMLGDVTLDGNIMTDDVSCTIQHIAGWQIDQNADVTYADVNGDGTVDTKDATLMLQYIAGWFDTFPNG